MASRKVSVLSFVIAVSSAFSLSASARPPVKQLDAETCGPALKIAFADLKEGESLELHHAYTAHDLSLTLTRYGKNGAEEVYTLQTSRSAHDAYVAAALRAAENEAVGQLMIDGTAAMTGYLPPLDGRKIQAIKRARLILSGGAVWKHKFPLTKTTYFSSNPLKSSELINTLTFIAESACSSEVQIAAFQQSVEKLGTKIADGLSKGVPGIVADFGKWLDGKFGGDAARKKQAN